MKPKKIKLIILFLILQNTFCISLSKNTNANYLESSLEIRTSLVPKSGNGVFSREKIQSNSIIGSYTGKFITEPEFMDLVYKNSWQYVMGVKDCTKQHLGKYMAIDGRENGSIATRINYAPKKFQNVKFEKLCDPPYVIVKTLRDIEKGEELYIDYGPEYNYEFMDDKDIQTYFKRTK